jgi:hypothetical protein
VLKEHNVAEENIILSNLFCTPFAAKSVMAAYPQVYSHCIIWPDWHNSGVILNILHIVLQLLSE